MLMRVPATSLAALRDLGAFAKSRRTSYFNLLTRIGFDYPKAHPQLTFTALGYLDQESAEEVAALREHPLVDEICGVTENAPPAHDDLPAVNAKDNEPFESPKPKAEKPATKPAAKVEKAPSKAKAALEDMVADIDAGPKADVKVEAVAEADVIEVEDTDDLASAIDGLDLDD
jgi:hypothetical protein